MTMIDTSEHLSKSSGTTHRKSVFKPQLPMTPRSLLFIGTFVILVVLDLISKVPLVSPFASRSSAFVTLTRAITTTTPKRITKQSKYHQSIDETKTTATNTIYRRMSMPIRYKGMPYFSSTLPYISESSASTNATDNSWTSPMSHLSWAGRYQQSQRQKRRQSPRSFRISSSVSETITTKNTDIDDYRHFLFNGLQQRWKISSVRQQRRQKLQKEDKDAIDSLCRMPWTSSIKHRTTSDSIKSSTTLDPTLLYMPFYVSQMEFMKSQLKNLRTIPCVSKMGTDMSYQENEAGTIRIHTVCFASDEYKYIRLTSLDGGDKMQVFTSVWYPNPEIGQKKLPLLGIDLLQFGSTRHVCICDFQPIVDESNLPRSSPSFGNVPTCHKELDMDNINYSNVDGWSSQLHRIRNRYPSLHGSVTNRFYNASDFYFSKNILVGRFNDNDIKTKENNCNKNTVSSGKHMVEKNMFPAVQSYMKVHVNMVKTEMEKHKKKQQLSDRSSQNNTFQKRSTFMFSAPSSTSSDSTQDSTVSTNTISECHAAYDTYSAERDPAHAMLCNMFGKKWADEYVYDILFPLSVKQK